VPNDRADASETRFQTGRRRGSFSKEGRIVDREGQKKESPQPWPIEMEEEIWEPASGVGREGQALRRNSEKGPVSTVEKICKKFGIRLGKVNSKILMFKPVVEPGDADVLVKNTKLKRQENFYLSEEENLRELGLCGGINENRMSGPNYPWGGR